MSRMQTSSPDYNVLRTYIDWLLDLEWEKATEDTPNLADAVAILEEDHYGLQKIKERITEYLAVLKLTTSLNAGQNANVPPDMVSIPPPISTRRNDLQAKNACCPNFFTLSGMTTLVNASHPENAHAPISSTPLPKDTLDNLTQRSNANTPIRLTESEIVTVFSAEFENEPSPISITESGMTASSKRDLSPLSEQINLAPVSIIIIFSLLLTIAIAARRGCFSLPKYNIPSFSLPRKASQFANAIPSKLSSESGSRTSFSFSH